MPDSDSFKVFRCDKITALHPVHDSSARSVDDLNRHYLSMYQGVHAIEFEVEIDEKGIDLFYKESYPSMNLALGARAVIQGAYPPEDEAFMAQYFISYGTWIRSVKPRSLQQAMEQYIHALSRHFKTLEQDP